MDSPNQIVPGDTLPNVTVLLADADLTVQDMPDATSSHVPREQSNNPPCTVHAIGYLPYKLNALPRRQSTRERIRRFARPGPGA